MKQETKLSSDTKTVSQNGITLTILPITSRSREGSAPKQAFSVDLETAFAITTDTTGAKTINEDASAVNVAKVFGGVESMSRYLSAQLARAMFSLQNPAKTKKQDTATVYDDAGKLEKLVSYLETIHEEASVGSESDSEMASIIRRMNVATKAGKFAEVGTIIAEMATLNAKRLAETVAAE